MRAVLDALGNKPEVKPQVKKKSQAQRKKEASNGEVGKQKKRKADNGNVEKVGEELSREPVAKVAEVAKVHKSSNEKLIHSRAYHKALREASCVFSMQSL